MIRRCRRLLLLPSRQLDAPIPEPAKRPMSRIIGWFQEGRRDSFRIPDDLGHYRLSLSRTSRNVLRAHGAIARLNGMEGQRELRADRLNNIIGPDVRYDRKRR